MKFVHCYRTELLVSKHPVRVGLFREHGLLIVYADFVASFYGGIVVMGEGGDGELEGG